MYRPLVGMVKQILTLNNVTIQSRDWKDLLEKHWLINDTRISSSKLKCPSSHLKWINKYINLNIIHIFKVERVDT